MIFIAALALSPLIVGCGSESNGSGVRVVATTGIVADLVEQVAEPGADIVQIIPDGSSPHDFQLSADDRQALEEADLIVSVGADLEAGIPVEETDTPRWELASSVDELLPFGTAGAHEAPADEEHADDEEEHGAVDPHVWMDPARVGDALPSLAKALGDIDPDRSDAYKRRADAYAVTLRELDRELRSTLAAIPAQERELVTSHDSLAYFADRYGFDVVATAFPSSGPEAEASATELQEVIDVVNARDVPTVFAQQEDNPQALRLVADQAGIEIEEGLVVESLASVGSYEELLRRDAELIAAGLDAPT